MKLFYTPGFNKDNPYLSEEESTHCLRVLRIREGESVHITNGIGELYTGNVLRKGKLVKIDIENLEISSRKRNYKLHMAVSPTKNIDRFEWFLEKATEIGIDEITPIIGYHSERKKIRQDRLEKIIVSAMKQSLQYHKPVLNPLMSFNDFIEQGFNGSQKHIAHCRESQDKKHIKHLNKANSDIILMIGPEGDFSEMEIEMAENNHFEAIELGKSRLRTETAAVVACHAINFLFDE